MPVPLLPAIDRFWNRVDRSGGQDACWLWTGYINNCGYGIMMIGSRRDGTRSRAVASRWIFEHLNGPLGTLLCCHHCDNPACCNPAHLFRGTSVDNMQDAKRKGRTRGGRPQPPACQNGHALVGYNAPISAGKRRGCRLCENARTEARRLANREADCKRQREYYHRRKQRKLLQVTA